MNHNHTSEVAKEAQVYTIHSVSSQSVAPTCWLKIKEIKKQNMIRGNQIQLQGCSMSNANGVVGRIFFWLFD